MLLCIDVGNTQIVFGLYDAVTASPRRAASGLLLHFRLPTRSEATADELALSVVQLLQMREVDPRNDVTGVVISSTNPSVGAAMADMTLQWFTVAPLMVGGDLDLGIENEYHNPSEVGADRLADAIAARDLFGAPVVVVDFGTATTFDVISPVGAYLGGSILPGVAISLDALFQRAAALRRVKMTPPGSVIGRSTEESLQSGTMLGYASLVEGMCARIEEEVGPCAVVATGGLAPLVTPFVRRTIHEEPWLTLHGLRLLFERNPHRLRLE
jgi:type III pantothenate kinase